MENAGTLCTRAGTRVDGVLGAATQVARGARSRARERGSLASVGFGKAQGTAPFGEKRLGVLSAPHPTRGWHADRFLAEPRMTTNDGTGGPVLQGRRMVDGAIGRSSLKRAQLEHCKPIALGVQRTLTYTEELTSVASTGLPHHGRARRLLLRLGGSAAVATGL